MEGLIFGILLYVKINRCRQLALDGLEDTDVDYTSNVAGSSPTYILPTVFLHVLSYLRTPIMYFK